MSSHERVASLFAIDDINLSVYVNPETLNTYRLASYAVVKRQGTDQTTKVYGLTESNGKIQFHFENSKMVLDFNQPRLISDKTKYDLDSIPLSWGYELIAYFPVVVKVALNNIDNFIVLGARICITTNGNISAIFST